MKQLKTAKNKTFLRLLLIFLTVNFLYYCKKSTNTPKDTIRNQAHEYKEIKDFNIQKNHNHTINPVKDLELIRGKKTYNEVAGLWQLDCSINNSGIEIYTDGKTITGSLALAPPAIFLNIILEKGEDENIYYLKYLSQDMDPPLASENEIDEENSSKSENIGKIVRKENNLEFTWYGIYNTKIKKRTNAISQFNESENPKSVILKRCNSN